MNANNPYEATKAPLIDAVPQAARRPWPVWVGLGIAWVFSLGVLAVAFVATWRVTRAPHSTGILGFVFLSPLALVVVSMLLQAGKGQNWARIGTTAWLCAVIAIGFVAHDYSKDSPFALLGALIPPTLLSTAAILLYVPAANRWFRACR
jgi:hypothetical protein